MDQRHDDATQKFMDDVAAGQPKAPSPYVDPKRRYIRTGLTLAKATTSPTPGTSMGKVLLRTGIGALAAKSLNEKTAAADHAPIHILDIYTKLNDKYGRGWWDWEPETVSQTLSYDYGIDLGDDGVNIVGALQTVLNTNFAHELWHVFEKVGHAFNTNHVDFTTLQPLQLDEIALTFTILNQIRPQAEYDQEVCAYIAAAAKSSGIVYLPPEWFPKCAQEHLDDLGNDMSLKGVVRGLYEHHKREHEDETIHNQLAALKEIEEYVKPHVIVGG